MQYLYHVLSLREPVFIRPAELSGIQQVFLINLNDIKEKRKDKKHYFYIEDLEEIKQLIKEGKDPLTILKERGKTKRNRS